MFAIGDFVILGPGSEWLWVMAQFIALALTGLAIFRQLRSQRSASLYAQMSAWNREFEGLPMVRHKLALMLAIQHRTPEAGLPRPNDEIPDFFERVGYLVSRGHIGASDFWYDARPVVSFYWALLAPYLLADRARTGDPLGYRWFEWLELEMRRIDRERLGRVRLFDAAHLGAEVASRIEIFRDKLRRERDDWLDDGGTGPATDSLAGRTTGD